MLGGDSSLRSIPYSREAPGAFFLVNLLHVTTCVRPPLSLVGDLIYGVPRRPPFMGQEPLCYFVGFLVSIRFLPILSIRILYLDF